MAFEPQHKFRCYCGHNGGCNGIRHNYKITKSAISVNSTTPSTTRGANKNSMQKFIKIKKKSSSNAGNKQGLGHSYSATSNSCYSRRNSANSLGSESSHGSGSKIHFAPDSISERSQQRRQQQRQRRRSSVDSFASSIAVNSEPDSTIWSKKSAAAAEQESSDGYTERRRCYENSKIFFQLDPELERAQKRAAAAAGMGFLNNLSNLQTKLLSEIPTNDVIAALQRFRLDNPDDCFNIYRQNDLKMERRLSESSAISAGSSIQRFIIPSEGTKNVECCCTCKCNAKLKETKGQCLTKVPLKFSKNDSKKKLNDDKKFQPLRPLDKSVALRFQS